MSVVILIDMLNLIGNVYYFWDIGSWEVSSSNARWWRLLTVGQT